MAVIILVILSVLKNLNRLPTVSDTVNFLAALLPGRSELSLTGSAIL